MLLDITENDKNDKIFPATPTGTNIGKYILLIPSPVEEKRLDVSDTCNKYVRFQ